MKKLLVVMIATVLAGCSMMSVEETQEMALEYCGPSNYTEGMKAEDASVTTQCGLFFGSDLAGKLE